MLPFWSLVNDRTLVSFLLMREGPLSTNLRGCCGSVQPVFLSARRCDHQKKWRRRRPTRTLSNSLGCVELESGGGWTDGADRVAPPRRTFSIRRVYQKKERFQPETQLFFLLRTFLLLPLNQKRKKSDWDDPWCHILHGSLLSSLVVYARCGICVRCRPTGDKWTVSGEDKGDSRGTFFFRAPLT